MRLWVAVVRRRAVLGGRGAKRRKSSKQLVQEDVFDDMEQLLHDEWQGSQDVVSASCLLVLFVAPGEVVVPSTSSRPPRLRPALAADPVSSAGLLGPEPLPRAGAGDPPDSTLAGFTTRYVPSEHCGLHEKMGTVSS